MQMPPREAEPHDAPDPNSRESPLERKLWIAGYVLIMLVLAAGAARRLMTLF